MAQLVDDDKEWYKKFIKIRLNCTEKLLMFSVRWEKGVETHKSQPKGESRFESMKALIHESFKIIVGNLNGKIIKFTESIKTL